MPNGSVSKSKHPTSTLAVRSTQGCWTCRLRRKKCDEVHPACQRCASVNVPCHYGPKPRWMEDAGLAKAELAHVKKLVSRSASLKRAAFRAGLSVPRPASTPICEGNSEEDFLRQTHPSDVAISSHQTTQQSLNLEENESSKTFLYAKWLEDHEASLIMHYLDQVFFIQFRFHTPSISFGGRGWLLSLLTRTKPLYHAALSLSALHQHCLLWQGVDEGEAPADKLLELERHHDLTLQELQVFIQAHSVLANTNRKFGGNIQILACMVELISFELFNGGTSNWEVHLKAAASLVLTLHEISEEEHLQPQNLYQPRPTTIPSESAALNFLSGAIIWFDIFACVSTSSKPHLYNYYKYFRFFESETSQETGQQRIQLETIMGCQSEVMVAISDIAQLEAWKNEESEAGTLNPIQLADRGTAIRFHLESKAAQTLSEVQNLQDSYNGVPQISNAEAYNRHTICLVTQVFVSAALIYLQTTLGPYLAPSSVKVDMENVVSFMRSLPDVRMIRSLVWPLCIAGCMAQTPQDQDAFRDLASAAISDSHKFGNSSQALEILEGAWKLQREKGVVVDCSTCIKELGNYVLLV